MADNTLLNLGSGGDTVATDDIAGIKHQRVKVEYGADGSATDVSPTTPLPVGFNASTATTAVIMQNAVAITANGTSLTTTGYGTATLHIGGTFTATVNFEVFNNVTSLWNSISATQIGNASISTTATAPGIYRITCTGVDTLRARVTWTSGTSITINGSCTNAVNASKIIQLAASTAVIGTTLIQDGSGNAIVTSTTDPSAAARGLIVRLAPNANVVGKVSIDQTTPGTTNLVALISSNLSVTATAAAGTAVTITLPAVAGQFHYITGIKIMKYASVAVVGAAAPVVVTSTNLPGSLAWTTPTAQAIGTQYDIDDNLVTPLKSSVVNTATTIVAPLTTSIIWRVTANYYTAA